MRHYGYSDDAMTGYYQRPFSPNQTVGTPPNDVSTQGSGFLVTGFIIGVMIAWVVVWLYF